MVSDPIYIVDEIGAIVSAVDAVTFPVLQKHINYMYGHPLEIIKRLQDLTETPDVTLRNSKYPLVALFQDFDEDRDQAPGVYGNVSLHMIIANITDQNYSAKDRYDHNFKPILYPIYLELLHQIASPGQKKVFVEDEELISHKKIDRLFWGKQGLYGNTANMFNDYLDCIEIQNLKISFYNQY